MQLLQVKDISIGLLHIGGGAHAGILDFRIRVQETRMSQFSAVACWRVWSFHHEAAEQMGGGGGGLILGVWRTTADPECTSNILCGGCGATHRA